MNFETFVNTNEKIEKRNTLIGFGECKTSIILKKQLNYFMNIIENDELNKITAKDLILNTKTKSIQQAFLKPKIIRKQKNIIPECLKSKLQEEYRNSVKWFIQTKNRNDEFVNLQIKPGECNLRLFVGNLSYQVLNEAIACVDLIDENISWMCIVISLCSITSDKKSVEENKDADVFFKPWNKDDDDEEKENENEIAEIDDIKEEIKQDENVKNEKQNFNFLYNLFCRFKFQKSTLMELKKVIINRHKDLYLI